jgi:hypothetical protein
MLITGDCHWFCGRTKMLWERAADNICGPNVILITALPDLIRHHDLFEFYVLQWNTLVESRLSGACFVARVITDFSNRQLSGKGEL